MQVGRYAVACATKREVEKLRDCWCTVAMIESSFMSLSGRSPKFGALKANLSKLETLLYENSLSSRGALTSGASKEEAEASESAF
jgi:hypothetical protein